jgi:hypothetical protein
MNRVTGKVYFEEKFDDGSKWLDRWVVSDWKKSDGTAGEWKLTAGEYRLVKMPDSMLSHPSSTRRSVMRIKT